MKMNRRDFLGFSAAFAAVQGMSGCAAARAVGLAGGGAKLRFGVVSDVHISAGGVKAGGCGDTVLLEKAFAYFRDRGADGVMIAGDMADWGLVEQLEQVGACWRKVFPGDRAPDGRHVEKLFVYGNHDVQGQRYGYAKRYGLPEEMFAEDRLIATDRAAAWKKVFGEEWAPIMMKEVKGYRFVLCHELEYPWKGENADYLERHRAELEGDKPFFYVQHFHLRGTTCAPWVWGQDGGHSTAALSKFPNAFALSGHSHTPLADDRVIWQGGFTSVGTASLRYLIALGGRENSYVFGAKDLGTQQMPRLDLSDCQHGMFVTVYDDCITLERRDFTNDRPVGPDWVVPLPYDGSLAFDRRGPKAAVPQFAAGAAVTVADRKGVNRAGKELDQTEVSFPNVGGDVRAFDFEVTVEAVDVDVEKPWLVKRVYSPGYYRAPERDALKVSCVFSHDELPPAYMAGRDGKMRKLKNQAGTKYRFAVRPCNCWGRKGGPIYSDWIG